jgi:thiamine pyrophosphokinase
LRCLILLNARKPEEMSERELEFYREIGERSDLVICADGGLNLALSIGITPNIVIGDMDSVDNEFLSSVDFEIIRYPREKDYTDGFLALQKAIDMGCDEITISNAISSEMDHSLANIQMMLLTKDRKVWISEPDVDVYLIDSSELTLKGNAGDRVSILPLSEKAEGIWIEGMKYGMKNGEFSIGGRNGISNEMVEKTANISVEKGLLVLSHHKKPRKSY